MSASQGTDVVSLFVWLVPLVLLAAVLLAGVAPADLMSKLQELMGGAPPALEPPAPKGIHAFVKKSV